MWEINIKKKNWIEPMVEVGTLVAHWNSKQKITVDSEIGARRHAVVVRDVSREFDGRTSRCMFESNGHRQRSASACFGLWLTRLVWSGSKYLLYDSSVTPLAACFALSEPRLVGIGKTLTVLASRDVLFAFDSQFYRKLYAKGSRGFFLARFNTALQW